MRVESIEELDVLIEGTILRINGVCMLLCVRREDGWFTINSEGILGPHDSQVVWEALGAAEAVAEVVSVPGGTWLSEDDYNYAAASAVYVNEITELLIRRSAMQSAELGFQGAPVYIEGHEILDLFLRLGEQYDIKPWVRGILGKDYNEE